jgi:hypothetical protein
VLLEYLEREREEALFLERESGESREREKKEEEEWRKRVCFYFLPFPSSPAASRDKFFASFYLYSSFTFSFFFKINFHLLFFSLYIFFLKYS